MLPLLHFLCTREQSEDVMRFFGEQNCEWCYTVDGFAVLCQYPGNIFVNFRKSILMVIFPYYHDVA